MSTTQTAVLMPFGKHQGKPIDQVPAEYLTWLVENERCGRVKPQILESLAARSIKLAAPKPAKKRVATNLSSTHYSWTDPTGRVCTLPNWITMNGRELEECPFKEAPYFEEVTDLDREFRSIAGGRTG
jgi:hypothetical protein